MGHLPDSASELIGAVERVTGVQGSARKETYIVRFTVTSSDGEKCGINIQMGKRTFHGRTSHKQVAEHLRVPLDTLEEVLEEWTPSQLRKHLQKYPASVLKSPATLRQFEEHDRQQATGGGGEAS